MRASSAGEHQAQRGVIILEGGGGGSHTTLTPTPPLPYPFLPLPFPSSSLSPFSFPFTYYPPLPSLLPSSFHSPPSPSLPSLSRLYLIVFTFGGGNSAQSSRRMFCSLFVPRSFSLFLKYKY